MFDTKRLVASAEELTRQISIHSDADHVLLDPLFSSLEPLIARAVNGEIIAPLDEKEIPGGYLIVEGLLNPYPDLQKALSRFSLLASSDHDQFDRVYALAAEVRDELESEE